MEGRGKEGGEGVRMREMERVGLEFDRERGREGSD